MIIEGGLSFQDYKVNYTVCDNISVQTCAVHKHGSRKNNDTFCPLIAPCVTFQKRNDKNERAYLFCEVEIWSLWQKKGALYFRWKWDRENKDGWIKKMTKICHLAQDMGPSILITMWWFLKTNCSVQLTNIYNFTLLTYSVEAFHKHPILTSNNFRHFPSLPFVFSW